MTDKIVVLTTTDDLKQAQRLARTLVEKRLAACVNIVPGMQSVYRWKEKIETADELLLVIKSSRTLFEALRSEIEKLHTYEVPEVVALPIVDGSAAYLSWLDREIAKAADQ